MGRLVILSGPSCVGKGPLYAALKKFYPGVAGAMTKFVLYDSRAPRPGEVEGQDYFFRSREEIEGFRKQRHFRVFEVRNDVQAMDTRELERRLGQSDVFFEGNPFIGSGLLDWAQAQGVTTLTVFLSPLSRDEILELASREPGVDLGDFVTDMMRRKLLRRTQRQNGILSQKDLVNVEIRAGSALREMQQAWRFDHVIVNHDGEDSDHWDAFYYPVGDARKAVQSFAALLTETSSAGTETWGQDLLG